MFKERMNELTWQRAEYTQNIDYMPAASESFRSQIAPLHCAVEITSRAVHPIRYSKVLKSCCLKENAELIISQPVICTATKIYECWPL